MTINGLGSVAAAFFGSPFPTTIYIGHPGWKALGARAGYSVLNGAFTVPGDGAVDFPALLKILYDARYAGWLVVEAEQDPAVAPSFAYAQKGYQHLARLIRNVTGSWQEAA